MLLIANLGRSLCPPWDDSPLGLKICQDSPLEAWEDSPGAPALKTSGTTVPLTTSGIIPALKEEEEEEALKISGESLIDLTIGRGESL